MTDLINQLRQELAAVTAEFDALKKIRAEDKIAFENLRDRNRAQEVQIDELQKQFAEVTLQLDAEREARKALQAALKTYNEIFFGDDQADAALALAAKLP